MDRTEKAESVAALKEVFNTSNVVVVAHYSGLSVAWWLEDGNADAAASTLAIGRAIGGVLAQVRS